MSDGPADRVRRVVCGVIGAAVDEAGAGGVFILDDATPEGELLHGWMTDALGAERVWRGTALARTVDGAHTPNDALLLAAARAVQEKRALLAHPMNRTTLLLGGRPAAVDLFPLGDVYASQVEQLTGACSLSPELEALAARAGGIAALDEALAHWIDERHDGADALATLPDDVAREMIDRFERGRYFRLRPRLVPKLGARTLGIDLFD